MNKKDKYRNILEVALSKASQALSDNDFEKVSESMDIIAESYGKYKEIKDAEDTLRNADFATLRRVFENAIPKLFVSKSKALNSYDCGNYTLSPCCRMSASCRATASSPLFRDSP